MTDLDVLKQAMGDLEDDLVAEKLDELISDAPDKNRTREIVAACQQSMDIVGEYYEQGRYFIGDLIFAGELLAACIDRLMPLLKDDEPGIYGKIVVGTVKGDIHDIGKNIFTTMMEASGFTVIDLGINQSPEAFVDAVREHAPHFVGLSGVMTLSIKSMKRTVDALVLGGLRDKVKILVGGKAVDAEISRFVGADFWSQNAAEAVSLCRQCAQASDKEHK